MWCQYHAKKFVKIPKRRNRKGDSRARAKAMVAARTESITVTLSKDSTDKSEEIRNLMNQVHQKGKEAAISLMKSNQEISEHGIALKEEDIMREFNVTGNKLTPITGGENSISISCVNDSNDNSKKRSAPPALEEEYFDGSDNEDSFSDDDDEEEDFDEDDQVIGLCLHCGLPPPPSASPRCTVASSGPTAPGIQVSCDDCHSFICTACHWCHEYQANHEIRVCDRCDAFYCKACDEMDQCEDCGEVVCGGCGSLCSCKFCGCGLCEDCATACGRCVLPAILSFFVVVKESNEYNFLYCSRCGIVLCARDAKFAVECDTCKMPYCLVCLASGTKDPCVRCGQKTSKRVEQLVHLRLKSIYKAFKQSGAALSGKGGRNNQHSSEDSRRSDSSDNEEHSRNRQADNHTTDSSTRDMPTWMAKKAGGSSSVSMPLPASVQRYAEMHGKESKKRTGNGHGRQSQRKGDVGITLEVDATMNASTSIASSSDCISRSKRGQDFFPDCSRMNGADDIHENYNNSKSNRNTNHSEKFASKTQAEADAAAAALLAELDEEKLQHEANSKAKKSKKKKKKQRQAAKEKEKEQNRLKSEESKVYEKAVRASEAIVSKKDEVTDRNKKQKSSKNKQAEKKKKETEETHPRVGIDDETARSKRSPQIDETNDSDDDDIALLTEKMNVVAKSKNETEIDEIEKNLADLVSQSDLDGIEKLLAKMKGVPGRAALRKNAKKAVKRIKEERISSALKQEQEQPRSNIDMSHSTDVENLVQDSDGTVPYRAPEPLLKVVSKNNRVTTPGQTPRYECVMHMAPSVVGWVIGKGGQRIRDLMEESGAKVWIDQDSMGPNDMRVVYVSGNKKSIELAVTMVKDLVAKAPVGGTTHGHTVPVPTSVHSINDASSVTSTRSSLTSTPVSLVQNFTQQVPTMAEKPSFSPVKKPEQIRKETTLLHPANDTLPPKPSISSIPDSGPTKPQLDMPPPPGLLSDMNLDLLPNSSPIKTNESQMPEAPRAVHELTCEPRFVALLIGRRGWTVKQIQDTSGARVDIDQTVNPRRIIISGDVDQVQHAVNLVRGVLSYPHAKQHYGATGGLDENGSDNIIGASTSASENFLAGISGPVNTRNDPFTAMPLANDNQIPSHNNHMHPSLLESNLNHFGNHQPEIMQHQPFNSGIGSNGPAHHSQMNVPPPTGYSGDDLAQSSMRSDPRTYMQRNHINPVVPVENQQFKSREFLNNQIPTDNLQYETILPLSGSVATQGNQMNPVGSHYQAFGNYGMENSIAVGQRTPSHNFGEQSTFGQSNDFSTLPSVEQDAVNSMFGSKVDDSLINSLNNFSFLDFLPNENIEKPLEQRNFGLGGVRLDSSSDNNPSSNESLPSLHHKDQKPIWGP